MFKLSHAQFRNLMVLFAALLMSASATQASADEYGSDADAFLQLIDNVQGECGSVNSEYRSEVIYDVNESQNPISKDLLARFTPVVRDQAAIWADTILEGDYEAQGDTRIDEIQALFKQNQLVGYRVTYSETAWYLGSCQYDYENKELLKDCDQGRIAESTFVSPEFTTWMRDEHAYAEFQD